MKKSAGILLFDKEKRFLLQQRTDDAPTYPGEFSFFGGKIEEGETPEAAIRRECIEELGYELTEPTLVFDAIVNSRYGKRHGYLFLEQYDPNKKLTLNEGKAMRWVKSEELNTLQINKIAADVLKKMYKKIKEK